MTEEIPPIKLLFSEQFKDRIRIIAKRYRSIRTDIQPLIDDLQIGKFIGDKIRVIGYTVFKVRLKNSDIQKGKSSGYRVIYQLQDNSCVLMLLIYAKSDQTDITAQQIQDIINKFDNS